MVVYRYSTLSPGEWLVKTLRLRNVHSREACLLEWCVIHKPSDHHMAWWPPTYDPFTRMIYRACVHGFDHPDPDALAVAELEYHRLDLGTHVCCPQECCKT